MFNPHTPVVSFRPALLASACLLLLASGPSPSRAETPRLFEWERGFGLKLPHDPSADMFMWIYEWNMFEAMKAGQHTHGTYQLSRTVDASGAQAVAESPAFRLIITTVEDGAELELRITNTTDYTWPDIAGVIPCWNPGQVPGTNPSMPLALNRNFSDPWRNRTFFVSAGGLAPLDTRAIHFNQGLRAAIERASDSGRFLFSNKWPTSSDDAVASLIVRVSQDDRWVTGIAWEDFLSVQGHNPWSCMHAGARIGALKPGESRTVRGRLYLFRGTADECLQRFHRDFPTAAQ